MGEKNLKYRYFVVGTLAVLLMISTVQAAVVTYKVAEVVPGKVGQVRTLKIVVATTTPVPTQATHRNIIIYSNPSGADLYIDNQLKGTTGINGITVTIEPRTYSIKLTKTLYLDYEETVDFGQDLSRTFALIPVQNTPFPTQAAHRNIRIDSNPSGATLSLDSVARGSTPATVTIEPGTHSIKLTKTGYYDFEQSVDFGQVTSRTFYLTPIQTTTKTITITPTFEPTSPTHQVTIYSNPSGATLSLDSVGRGPTPATLTVSPGPHTIRLTMPGYLDYSEPCVDFGQNISWTFYLTPVQTTTITATITPTQTPASHRNILIDSVPSGAHLTVDSQDWGATPTTVTILTGLHTIRLTKSGFYDYVASVDFGEDTFRTFSLSPVQGTTPVITVTPTITISPSPSRPPGFSASTFIIALIIVTLAVGIRRSREGL